MSTTVVSDDQLYQLLLQNQYLEEKKLKEALQESQTQKIPLAETLVQKDLISDENLGKLTADYLKVPFISLAKTSIDLETLQILPETIAKTHHTVVFKTDEAKVHIASSDTTSTEFFSYIGKKTGLVPAVYFATPIDIEDTLRFYKKDIQTVIDKLFHADAEKKKDNPLIGMPVETIVSTIIQYGYDDKASDIHIEPRGDFTLIRFRIDGVLHDMITLPHEHHEQIVRRIKILAQLRTDEHASAQDGKFHLSLDREDIDIRVSVVPITRGEKCVLRLLSSHFRQFGLTDLGMNEGTLQIVTKAFQKPYGMVLATGPTGAGKTTTNYAILKIINSREKNIATIEDPVEYEISGVNQIQVNPKTNLTFAEGLRSILRQDPDIVYIGEIRDEETAGIATNSAMTGHLVLSTLHTNNAATSLPRLMDMNIEPFIIASTVNVIVAQRLVRRICEKCRVSSLKARSDLSTMVGDAYLTKYFGKDAKVRLYAGKGCPICHGSGYTGRLGIFEALEITEDIQKLIMDKADAQQILKQAIKEGMITMFEDGLAKVQQGLTTIDEILRVTSDRGQGKS